MLGALAGAAHVSLSADYGNFRRDMRAAEKEFLRSTRNMSREASISGRNLGRGIGLAVLGTVGPMFLLGRAIRGSYQELVQMRREAAQTEAVIESTGGVANVTADRVARMADEMLRLSGVDDQVAQRGLNVLLTFTRIRNEVGAGNDIYDQASEALLDMVYALERGEITGEAMSSGAIRLGRALQDPVRGVTALRRVGVAFTKDEEAMIKRLVEAGDVIGAQKVLLAELTREFGGSAQAAGEEFPAALARMREAALGAGAAFLETLTPMIVENAEQLENWLARWQENEEAQQEFRETVEGIVETIKDLVTGADDVAEALGGWETTLKILIALKFASIILGWTRMMKVYTAQTKQATFWTGALGAAQLFGGGLPINPRTGAPIPGRGRGGGGLLGRAGQALGRYGRFAPSIGTVAVGSAIVLSQTPGASGAKAGDRRAAKASLFNGEWADEYPYLSIAAGAVRDGRASPREMALIKSLGEPPWSEGKLSAAERRARRFLDTSPGPTPKFPRGQPPKDPRDRPPLKGPRTELSVGTETALIQAGRTETDVDDLNALQRAERELNQLLKQDDLTKQERLGILTDLAGVEDDIERIHQDRADTAQKARDDAEREREERQKAAQEARENAYANRVYGLEQKVNRAAETEWLGDDLIALNRLLAEQVRWRNAQKKGTEAWRDAQSDVDATQAAIREVVLNQRDARQARKAEINENRLWEIDRKVARAEETETFADDEKWLKKKRALLVRIRQGQKRYSDEWKATQEEIDAVNAAIRQGRKKAADDEKGQTSFDFVSEFLRLQSEYGPNIWGSVPPGFAGGMNPAGMDFARSAFGGRSKPVFVGFSFPNAPTDYHREARFAAAAAAAVFDG